MKIQVQTTSQKLSDLLSASDKDLIMTSLGSASPYGRYLVLITNSSVNDIFVELYKDADTTNSVKIASTSNISLSVKSLDDIRLISTAVSDVDVLITI